MTTTIRILTTSTLDSSPSVLLTSPNGGKILINCGDGCQRTFLESAFLEDGGVVGDNGGDGGGDVGVDGVGGGGVIGDNVGKLNDKSKVPNAATTATNGGGGVAAPGSLKISNVHSICLTHLGFDTVDGKSVFDVDVSVYK